MDTPSQSKTIAFTCSCGATEALPAALRGIEQSCAECGRIFRIPTVGDELDLRTTLPDAKDDEVIKALEMLSGPQGGFDPNATSRTLVRLVFLILVLGAIAFGVYFLALA